MSGMERKKHNHAQDLLSYCFTLLYFSYLNVQNDSLGDVNREQGVVTTTF